MNSDVDLIHMTIMAIAILFEVSLCSFLFSLFTVFENKEKIVLVMEFASRGELYDYADRSDVLEEEEVQRLFRQIVSAVAFCHMVSVSTHTSLKR